MSVTEEIKQVHFNWKICPCAECEAYRINMQADHDESAKAGFDAGWEAAISEAARVADAMDKHSGRSIAAAIRGLNH